MIGIGYTVRVARPSAPARALSRTTRDALALLGGEIRAARLERGWSVAELGERIGGSRDLVQRIEQGDPRCGIGSVFEAATVVGVTLYDRDPGRLAAMAADQAYRLKLLPKSARRSRKDDLLDGF